MSPGLESPPDGRAGRGGGHLVAISDFIRKYFLHSAAVTTLVRGQLCWADVVAGAAGVVCRAWSGVDVDVESGRTSIEWPHCFAHLQPRLRERESPGWLERLKKSMIAAAAAAVFAVRETGRDTRTCCGSSSALATCLSLCLSPCEVWPQVFQAAGEPAVVSSYILPAGLQWAVISPLSV